MAGTTADKQSKVASEKKRGSPGSKVMLIVQAKKRRMIEASLIETYLRNVVPHG